MEFIEVIQKRHSVRKFTGEPIERELLDAILDIAGTAPSSKNSHSSAFMVVDDKDTLSAISEMRDRGSAFVKDAAAAIVVMGDHTKTDIWVENALPRVRRRSTCAACLAYATSTACCA